MKRCEKILLEYGDKTGNYIKPKGFDKVVKHFEDVMKESAWQAWKAVHSSAYGTSPDVVDLAEKEFEQWWNTELTEV